MFKNNKKRTIIVICTIATLLIFIIPIPRKISSDEGSVFTLTSLTYKYAKWDMYENSEKPYSDNEFLIFPKNFVNTQNIWEEKYNDLRLEGYGAVSSVFRVTKIEGKQVWIEEISTDSFQIKDCVIGEHNINKYGKNITFDNIKVGDTLKIQFSGEVLETYPSTLSMIYSIELSK